MGSSVGEVKLTGTMIVFSSNSPLREWHGRMSDLQRSLKALSSQVCNQCLTPIVL